MTNLTRDPPESPIQPVAQAVAEHGISRGAAMKALVGGVVGGLASLFVVRAPGVEARQRRQVSTLWFIFSRGIRGNGWTTYTVNGGGDWTVCFNRPVGGATDCAYTAQFVQGHIGFIGLAEEPSDDHCLSVATYNPDQRLDAKPFHLVITC